MAVNIHITIIELNALHTKRQNLFQELDAVIHLLMEARSEERFSRNAETDLVCRLLLEKKNAVNGAPRRSGAVRTDAGTPRRQREPQHVDGVPDDDGALQSAGSHHLHLRAD